MSCPLPAKLDDNQLAQRFYPGADTSVSSRYQVPDWSAAHQALKRKGMTKQLLGEEYAQQRPNRCYSYSQFCVRQTHLASEECFVGDCGQAVPVLCAGTGEVRQAQVFVGVLGVSNYTYAGAALTQSLPDWLGSRVRMFAFFGGCPELLLSWSYRGF
ncbi:MAG: hypothetical protein KZQ88_07770 [Candidatus Thiodiazotropha sp. (ex Dulcina madagascariensis)]|nr:hypothetical protein [Candidatus Thiodiazotropha sp. (ex Dulcina madagascariensis)]MCU7926380.1 hypothetical protein [Candidatus Thiodiazotropha sp. (ex Dulcina madagascariensis)]